MTEALLAALLMTGVSSDLWHPLIFLLGENVAPDTEVGEGVVVDSSRL